MVVLIFWSFNCILTRRYCRSSLDPTLISKFIQSSRKTSTLLDFSAKKKKKKKIVPTYNVRDKIARKGRRSNGKRARKSSDLTWIACWRNPGIKSCLPCFSPSHFSPLLSVHPSISPLSPRQQSFRARTKAKSQDGHF